MTDIETLRNELSELDLKIIELVHRRQVLSEEIGAIKRKKGRPTRDYQREREGSQRCHQAMEGQN